MRLRTFYTNGGVPVDFLGDRKALVLICDRRATDLLPDRTAVDTIRGGLPAVYLNHES